MQERAGRSRRERPELGPDVGVGLTGSGHRPTGTHGDPGAHAPVRRAGGRRSRPGGERPGGAVGLRPDGTRSWAPRSSDSARAWTTDGGRRSARPSRALRHGDRGSATRHGSTTAAARRSAHGRIRYDADARHGDTRPMRSPSAGSVEDSSSARFQPSRRSNPPDGIPPVEGLRMRQVFDHEPVMVAEVVALFAPVPAGRRHRRHRRRRRPRRGTPRGAPASPCARARPRSRRRRRRHRDVVEVRRTAPPCAMPRFDHLADEIAADAASSEDQVSGVLFDLGVSSPQLDTARAGLLVPRTTDHSTCAWTRRPARPPPTS